MSRLFRGRKQMRRHPVEVAYSSGVIRDRGPYLKDETNRTRVPGKRARGKRARGRGKAQAAPAMPA